MIAPLFAGSALNARNWCSPTASKHTPTPTPPTPMTITGAQRRGRPQTWPTVKRQRDEPRRDGLNDKDLPDHVAAEKSPFNRSR